jgi:NADH oxidase (H2O2-forming)
MKIVIIGGSTSGTICAWELRKLNKDCEIIIIEESNNFQYSPCAMPYVLSGETSKDNIVLLSKKDYEDNNIILLNNSKVSKILPDKKEVVVNNEFVNYDFLVLATGSSPFNPGIKISSDNYSFFKNLQDLDKISKAVDVYDNFVVIGAGFIGVETAQALRLRNKNVVLVEAKNQVLPEMLDEDMSLFVEDYLKNQGINIFKNEFVKELVDGEVITNNRVLSSDFVIVSTGVKPRLDIISDAGIIVDKGVVVNEFNQTNFSEIYACGDCAESVCAISNNVSLTGLANSAYSQAKVVASNILGLNKKSKPVLFSSISKIGDLFVGSAGLNLNKSNVLGEKIVFSKLEAFTKAEYYSKDTKVLIKLLATIKGRLVGAQFIGDENISGYLSLLNLAISKNMVVEDLCGLETPYNPASNPLHDPVISASKILLKKIHVLNKQQNT